jgi:putative hemolysin
MILIPILVLFGLLLLNGVFAMSELAVMTSRRSRLQQKAAGGDAGAAAALKLADDPTRFLSTVQVGITLIGILAGAYGEKAISTKVQEMVARVPALEARSDLIALIIVVLGITYFSLVLGELVPKRLALAFPEAVAALIARPLSVLSFVTALPVRVLTGSTELVLRVLRVKPRAGDDVSEEDVRSLVSRAASTGVLTPQEHALLQRTMRAADLTAEDLMVPRNDVVWIDAGSGVETVRVLAGTNPHSHFPVCRGSMDQILGVVHIKDLVAYGLLSGGADFRVDSVMQKPLYVPDTCPALTLLERFRAGRTHVAIVVDEYGGTSGLLTLNDVVRSIVGDIARVGEEQAPTVVLRKDGSLLIDGRLPVHELVIALMLGPEAEDGMPEARTTAGLVTALLGHIAVKGEGVAWHGWRLEVVDMDGARVDQVLATRVEESAGE